MNKSSDLGQIVSKFLSLVGDAILFVWQFFYAQVTILLSTRWEAQSAPKLLIVAVVVVVIFLLVWRFVDEIRYILVRVGVLTSFLLGFFLSVGLFAAMVNWLLRTVPA